MKIFRVIAAAISGFFKSAAAKKILGHAISILKELVGRSAETLALIAKEEVERAEAHGGPDKYEQAFKAIRGRLYGVKEIGENAINIAIELAVAAMRKELESR